MDPVPRNPDNARPAAEAPSGLFAQLAATRAAAIRMVRAHIDLAMAEANDIKGEVLRTLALGRRCGSVPRLRRSSCADRPGAVPRGVGVRVARLGVLLGSELMIAAAVFAVLVR